MSKISDYIRKTFEEGDNIRDRGLTTPEDVVRYDDISYGPDRRWQVLDVYRPRREEGKKLPVIVSVHGGGWVYGDKERYQYYCMDLARRGFAVVNFTYRLAPEFLYPSPLEDTNLVFAWVMEHAHEYAMDRDNIFAVGDSAGAHSLGLYAAMATNRQYEKKYPFSIPEGLRLNAIVLNCGVGEIRLDDDLDDTTHELMRDYLPQKGSPREEELISMIHHVTEDYPPVFIMTAVDDFLKMQALVMAKALMEKNVPLIMKCYGDKDHRLAHVFHLDIRSEAAKQCNDEECGFLREYLRS